mgnify:CR=1 FL=1
MDLDFNFLNIIILFGAVQGYILCIYIFQKRFINKASVAMFVLFLFCLAFLNMMYVFLDWDLFKYYRPLHMFPFPYKWIIAPAFYFYIKNQFAKKEDSPFHKKEWWLFLPALIYFFLRLYWFSISVSENNYRITLAVVNSNYFRIQEFFYLGFNMYLGWLALRFLKVKIQEYSGHQKTINAIQWLVKFILVFIFISAAKIILFAADLVYHDGQESFLFLYPTLFINVIFIYWIGYIGFSKPKVLFNLFKTDSSMDNLRKSEIEQKLSQAIDHDEVFINPNLNLSSLATSLDISTKELSIYINEIHQMNFSEYLNLHRIEKVKQLLASPDAQKYTLVTLAEEAGFSSKSSFNATFKKVVGMTPSAYRKQRES